MLSTYAKHSAAMRCKVCKASQRPKGISLEQSHMTRYWARNTPRNNAAGLRRIVRERIRPRMYLCLSSCPGESARPSSVVLPAKSAGKVKPQGACHVLDMHVADQHGSPPAQLESQLCYSCGHNKSVGKGLEILTRFLFSFSGSIAEMSHFINHALTPRLTPMYSSCSTVMHLSHGEVSSVQVLTASGAPQPFP